jgi:methionyl-tRNA formyltransferase
VRIVVLTYGGDYAEHILLRLAARGVLVEGLVIVDPPSARAKVRRARTLRLPPRTIAAGALRRALVRVEGLRVWSGLARDVVHGGHLNGTRLLETLRALAPDYLVLARLYLGHARAGLIDEIVAIPNIGTFNAHPGLLPWVRGSGVIENSIERRIAVGVTAHLVHAGLDTGPILQRRLVPVLELDTLETLRRKALELCAGLVVDTVSSFSPESQLPISKEHARYPACTWPTADALRQIELDVAAGIPRKVYAAWRAQSGGDLLPADFVAPSAAG